MSPVRALGGGAISGYTVLMLRRCSVLVFALVSSACVVTTGSSTLPSSGAGSSNDENGPAPSGAPRCVGKPVEAYTVDDATSCFNQGSDWDSRNLECRGTSFVVNCARAESLQRPEEAAKIACLDMPGCGWTEADGTVTKPSGRCEGTKIPCTSLSQGECKSQPGCTLEPSDRCTAKNGRNYLENVGCDSLQISNTVSFSVVRDACRRAKGCTWVD